jgi:hypothetical protein
MSTGLSDNTMLIQQDTLRRDILRERDMPEKHSIIELTELLVEFGRERHRTVIVEGIFSGKKYGPMFSKIASKFERVCVYYFDLPFEETLARHATKPNAHEFGENEMREWWNEKDFLGMPNEKIFDKEMGFEDIVQIILTDAGAVQGIR